MLKPSNLLINPALSAEFIMWYTESEGISYLTNRRNTVSLSAEEDLKKLTDLFHVTISYQGGKFVIMFFKPAYDKKQSRSRDWDDCRKWLTGFLTDFTNFT